MKKLKKEIVGAVNFYNDSEEFSLTEVSEKFKIDRHSLSKYLKEDLEKYKYEFGDSFYYLDENEEKAVKYYLSNEDCSFSDIKRKFGYKQERFKEKLKVYNKNPSRRFKVSFDRNIFSTIDSEEKAYWLGFILADGSINQSRYSLKITLGEKDFCHLKKFCLFIGLNDIHIKPCVGGFGTKCYTLLINSKDMILDLNKCGIFQNKSTREKPFYSISTELKPHYIRGIIDGDGYIRKTLKRFGCCGSIDVLNFILEDMKDYGIIDKVDESKFICRKGKIWNFEVWRQNHVKRGIERYYKNSTIFLDRKKELANDILNRSIGSGRE